ncbi:hypothetical protein ACT7CZ_14970, partial [Bacillus cereus]
CVCIVSIVCMFSIVCKLVRCPLGGAECLTKKVVGVCGFRIYRETLSRFSCAASMIHYKNRGVAKIVTALQQNVLA